MTITIFLTFVAAVLGLSFYFGQRVKSAGGYYAAGGQIHWSVNGIAFAGDYLSAASFLGICGMIATAGYDGFLYSIGYLAGWVVALFVVAEPLKRMGKYTLTDAVDLRFDSRAIKLTAAVGTLIISICYLIPQMVGAGVLIEPLLNLPHYVGVIMVGGIVITIVATAGMTSTTYVQFLKGALLIIFSTALVAAVCVRGISTTPDQGGLVEYQEYRTVGLAQLGGAVSPAVSAAGREFVKVTGADGGASWWEQVDGNTFTEIQWETRTADGRRLVNGEPEVRGVNELRQVGGVVQLAGKTGAEAETGSITPWRMLALLGDPETLVRIWKTARITDGEDAVTLHFPTVVAGNKLMRPGMLFRIEGTFLERLDFVSLMLALFLGTAALPHILIRYYTVPSPAAARKSTIVAIAAIGTFYILTLFMGLGALVNQTINPLTDNMSAPLLARSFGTFLFASISAIAFATVLGTVAGLIVAASGAVAHDLMDRFAGLRMTEKAKVRAGKLAAVAVGLIAIVLGILFRGMNVSFLVGLAFAIAASANLPSILGIIFWKKTTWQGISASMMVGVLSAVGLILLSPTMYPKYGLPPEAAPFPLMNPGIVSIPLSFATLILVSLLTWRPRPEPAELETPERELVAAAMR
jgi:cation/acetate symporter